MWDECFMMFPINHPHQLNMNKPKKVYVVDNGGQWTHRIWRVLRDLGCETKIIENTTPVEKIDADALVLSGGAPRVAWESPKLGRCTEYLEKFKGPILGICVGHQLMAAYYGGVAQPAESPEYGMATLTVTKKDDLFIGLPDQFTVWESHNDEVKSAKDFIVLAHSQNCHISAMKHVKKPHYGVQFHPEVNNTQYGDKIYENFVKMIK